MTDPPALDSDAVFGATLIRAGDIRVSRGEVLRWAERWDPGHAARVRRRAALGAVDPEVAAEAVESAAAEFRYERELEEVEALTEWLAQRGLTVTGWWEATRRNVLAEYFAGMKLPGEEDEPLPGPTQSDEDPRVWHADLVLSDLLMPPTEALVRRIAVARGTPGWTIPDDASTLDDWAPLLEQAWEAWRAPLVSDARVRQVVQGEQLQLMTAEVVETHWPSADSAQEALACARFDGTPLLEVAASAEVPAFELAWLVGEAPGPVGELLRTAAAGELVGPIETPTHWAVLLVRAKRPPDLADPVIRAAAEQLIEREAARRLVAAHISLPEPTG